MTSRDVLILCESRQCSVLNACLFIAVKIDPILVSSVLSRCCD